MLAFVHEGSVSYRSDTRGHVREFSGTTRRLVASKVVARPRTGEGRAKDGRTQEGRVLVRGLRTVERMNHSHLPRATPPRWNPRLLHDLVNARDLSVAAQHLISRDVPVFPCVPGGKLPLTAHGFKDASTARSIVEDWWRRWPDANIGVPTGAAGGIDVVDVDVHDSGSGFPAFECARRAGFVEGWAWLVDTPSGGLHAYFLRTNESKQRSWQVPNKHIDFRGDGGYIIIPPSRIMGEDGSWRSYTQKAIAQHQPGAVDAAGLRGFLDPPRPIRPPADAPAAGTRPAQLAVWVASRPVGDRNGGLFWAACRMAEKGFDLSEATTVLGEAAYTAGLPEREALSTIRSAYRRADQASSPPPERHLRVIRAVGL